MRFGRIVWFGTVLWGKVSNGTVRVDARQGEAHASVATATQWHGIGRRSGSVVVLDLVHKGDLSVAQRPH